jgi:hypothetical protein
MGMENWENNKERGKPKHLQKKSDQICQLQIPHRLACNETRDSGVIDLGYGTVCCVVLLSLFKLKISFRT